MIDEGQDYNTRRGYCETGTSTTDKALDAVSSSIMALLDQYADRPVIKARAVQMVEAYLYDQVRDGLETLDHQLTHPVQK